MKLPTWAEKWTVMLTGGILVATSAYTVVSCYQLRAMRDAVRTTERPWLVLKAAKDLDLDAKPREIVFVLLNTGRGPALNVRARVGAPVVQAEIVFPNAPNATPVPVPFPAPLPTDTDKYLGPWQSAGGVLGGGLEHEINVAMDQVEQGGPEFVRTKKKTLYLIGEAEYSDQFDEHHATRFCGFWDPDAKAWRLCPGGNSAS